MKRSWKTLKPLPDVVVMAEWWFEARELAARAMGCQTYEVELTLGEPVAQVFYLDDYRRGSRSRSAS